MNKKQFTHHINIKEDIEFIKNNKCGDKLYGYSKIINPYISSMKSFIGDAMIELRDLLKELSKKDDIESLELRRDVIDKIAYYQAQREICKIFEE